MSKNIVYVLILCTFPSCTLHSIYESEPLHIVYAENVLSSSGKKLAKKYDMHLFGNSGSMMTCVKTMGLSFQIFNPLTQDEARELIIDCAMDFIDDINNNPSIRPYLVSYPFKPENIEIAIFSRNSDNSFVYDPFIRVVGTHEGKVTFATEGPETKFDYKNYYVETFDEALAKVKE